MAAQCLMCKRCAAALSYALTVADAMIRAGNARRALVVGAEVFSRILDFQRPHHLRVVWRRRGRRGVGGFRYPGILASDLHADGRYIDILCVPGHV